MTPYRVLAFVASFLLAPAWLAAASAQHAAQIPSGADFVHSLEGEAFLGAAGGPHTGIEGFRLATQYVDPDVNAFVGIITSLSHFNRKMDFGTAATDTQGTGSVLWDWGAKLGLIRGPHLWELDLMGASLGGRIAFAPGIAGEHSLGAGWRIYHRTTPHFFVGFTLLDSDQGLAWYPSSSWGLSAGYRFLAGQHVSSQNGPRVGIVFRFQSPKIPFIFPSLG
jgi:hypothetical protein